MTCDKAMKIIEDDNARKCEKKQEASKNQAEIEELYREIEEKNKMLLKIKENLAGDMESVRKACNRKFHKKEVSDLKGEFKSMEQAMGRLIKAKAKEDDSAQRVKDEIAEAKCDLKHLQGKKATMDECGCAGKNIFGCCNEDGEEKPKGAEIEGLLNDGGCPVSTMTLRSRARRALARLQARE